MFYHDIEILNIHNYFRFKTNISESKSVDNTSIIV